MATSSPYSTLLHSMVGPIPRHSVSRPDLQTSLSPQESLLRFAPAVPCRRVQLITFIDLASTVLIHSFPSISLTQSHSPSLTSPAPLSLPLYPPTRPFSSSPAGGTAPPGTDS